MFGIVERMNDVVCGTGVLGIVPKHILGDRCGPHVGRMIPTLVRGTEDCQCVKRAGFRIIRVVEPDLRHGPLVGIVSRLFVPVTVQGLDARAGDALGGGLERLGCVAETPGTREDVREGVELGLDRPVSVGKTWDSATFRPIRDNQPFLAGNVQHIFSLQQVGTLFALTGGLLLAFAALLLWLVRRRGNPGIPGRSFPQLLLISLFVGANFLVIEHYLILALFEKLYVYRDALVLGAISFLVISGLGSTFIKPRWRPLLQFTGGVFILLLLLYHEDLSPWANLLLLAPVAFVTGSFFPALFEAAAENPLGVFAADSIGAAAGSLASFFIPIVFGFSWFFVFATMMFWATAMVLAKRAVKAPIKATARICTPPGTATNRGKERATR